MRSEPWRPVPRNSPANAELRSARPRDRIQRAAGIVVHVLANAEALDAQPDTAMSGLGDGGADPDPIAQPGSAVIVGGGEMLTPLLAELIRNGARIRQLRKPSDADEPRYRPSTALASSSVCVISPADSRTATGQRSTVTSTTRYRGRWDQLTRPIFACSAENITYSRLFGLAPTAGTIVSYPTERSSGPPRPARLPPPDRGICLLFAMWDRQRLEPVVPSTTPAGSERAVMMPLRRAGSRRIWPAASRERALSHVPRAK